MARIDGLARFTVKQNLDYAADSFQAEVNNAGLFTAADPGDAVSLYHGFKDSTGAELTVGRLVDGVVDEYILKITPNRIVEELIGRDKNAWLLDRNVYMQFLRSPRRQILQQVAVTPPQPT